MFFQIRKDGQSIDGGSYSTLEEACAALEKSGQAGEVAEVDRSDRLIRRYTLLECRKASRKYREEAPR